MAEESSTELVQREAAQQTVARALACGISQKKAAQLAGVSDRTVRNWMTETAFRDLLDDETRKDVERIEPLLARTRSEILHGLSVGTGKLIELTEAEVDSLPVLDVQEKAAGRLAANGVALLRVLGEKEAQVTTPGGQTVIVQLNVTSGDESDEIDGEVEEVEEDGDGQGD